MVGENRVASFYAGKTVFVTGATGFLGGILVEKLLRSCPDVGKVFVLIRKKKGAHDVQERLRNMFKLPLYSKLGEDALCKVEAVEGDVSQPGLQLSPEASEMLIRSVDVVFHVAACINFRAPLDRAIRTNLQGTATLLNLAKNMKNIKAFVYTSTAYCNCTQRDIVAEEVYPTRFNPNSIMELPEKLTPEEIREQTPELLGGHPNTYSFTKLLAENYVKLERDNVPVAIVRPSIVLGTLRDPIPGWVDNVNNGAFAFIAGAGRGVFRTLLADGSRLADLVPSDLLASLLVVSAWKAAQSRGFEIYHFTSGTVNPITWGEYCDYTVAAIQKYPCTGLVYYPKAKTRAGDIRNELYFTITHYLPAVILDFLFRSVSFPNILLEVQSKYKRGTAHSGYFTRNEWLFSKSNTESLFKELKENEKKEFDFEIRQVEWKNYMESCTKGIRKFYHGESESTLPWARIQLASWRIADAALTGFVFFLVTYFALSATGYYPISIIIGLVLTALYIWF